MPKLKINAIADDRPVKLTVELPGAVFRTLSAYAEILKSETNQSIEVSKLIPPMLERFMASDREFIKAQRAKTSSST
jgi:hypothetical protein